MFYKWIKWLLLAAVTASLGFTIGLISGRVGLQFTGMTFQLFLITTGLFIFYHTRKGSIKHGWLVFPVMLMHIAVLPLTVVMVLAVNNEQLAYDYWFIVNVAMLLGLGMVWLLIVAGLPLPVMVRALLVLLSSGYVVLLCLHMSGWFANGKVIFFSGISIFLVTILLVALGIRKRPSPPEKTPTAR